MSFAPNFRATWPISFPCVTQEDWIFGMLSMNSRLTAWVRRYSALDTSRPPKAVFSVL